MVVSSSSLSTSSQDFVVDIIDIGCDFDSSPFTLISTFDNGTVDDNGGGDVGDDLATTNVSFISFVAIIVIAGLSISFSLSNNFVAFEEFDFDDDESDIDFVRPLLAESSIGCRIRLRALINQLFTCNKGRFVSDAMVRFSSSVGYGC